MRRMIRILFAIYILIMLWLLFGQRITPDVQTYGYFALLQERLNLIPFRTIAAFARASEHSISSSHAFINLAGNVIMFIPLGAALPAIWMRFRRFWHCMAAAFLILLAVELFQLFTLLGSADIDDLILNLIGIGMGCGIFHVLFRRFPKLFL